MCGRFALTHSPEVVRNCFGYIEQPEFPPRFNIAPTQPIAVVQRSGFSADTRPRHFRLVRWGFVPAFVKDFSTFRPIINVRLEDLATRNSVRNAFRRRRCLVITDGFYLWRKQDRDPSVPFLLRRPDRLPFGMAGLNGELARGRRLRGRNRLCRHGRRDGGRCRDLRVGTGRCPTK